MGKLSFPNVARSIAVDAKNSCVVRVGRLLEIDVARGYHSVADVDAMTAAMRSIFENLPPGRRIIIAADWRDCPVLAPEVAAHAVHMFTASNPHVERSAILVRPNQATSTLQVARLIGESDCNVRRVFRVSSEMKGWLGEVLDAAERERLVLFLSGR